MRMPEITKVGHGAAETMYPCAKHCDKAFGGSRVVVAIYGV